MKRPVVFVPGSLCDRRLFAAQIEGLDLPCHVADLAGAASIETMADRVLRDAPPQFALVGLSLGGVVAAEVAARAPQRVEGLALLDTNLDAPDSEQLRTRRRWDADVRAGHLPSVVQELVSTVTIDPRRHGRLIAAMALEAGPAVFLEQNTALMRRHDRRPIVAGLATPTLIACGRDDEICSPDLHADLADRSPHARLTVVAEAGHLSTIDQPAALTGALTDWLDLCNTNPTRRGTTHECTTA